jgi:HPt (histidine-containing phosphotransfer) domain-containing protein
VIGRIRELEQRGAARLLERLISTYLDSARKLVADAERALQADDANALRQASHTLKSSSANLGASELSARSAELESLARAGRVADARAQWPAVRSEFERAVRALDRLAQQASGPS